MSHEDPYRPNPGRDRGAYTPPTDDDLPFNRQGYDPRRVDGGGKGPPVTLLISVLVLAIIVVVVFAMFMNGGLRKSEDAPPAVGKPVGQMKVQAPVDAQPVDPEAGIDVYRAPEPAGAVPTFTPPPEAVRPRPAPRPVDAAPLPPTVRPAPAPEKAAPAAPAAGGTSGVQIGAFSTPSIAEREYGAVVARFPQFTRGGGKRVQEVTASNGSTVYRTTVTGLSREQATSLCSAIKAAGDDCIVR
jgi:hypothetical protein